MTDSTLKPIVGIVVTTSPICVLSAASWCMIPGWDSRADLESVKQCSFAGIVLYPKSSATLGTLLEVDSSHQAQNQYSYLLF